MDSLDEITCECVFESPDVDDGCDLTVDSFDEANCQIINEVDIDDNCDLTTDSFDEANCLIINQPPDCDDGLCSTADTFDSDNCECIFDENANCDDGCDLTADSYDEILCECVYEIPDVDDGCDLTADSFDQNNCVILNTAPTCDDGDDDTADSFDDLNCLCINEVNCPTFIVEAGPNQLLDCDVTSVVLQGSTDATNVEYQWTGNGINATNENILQPTVSEEGWYYFTIIDIVNDCETSVDSVFVESNITEIVAEVKFAEEQGVLDCTIESLILDASSSTSGDNIIYIWESNSEILQSGPNTSLTVLEGGTYLVTVIDTITTCAQTDFIDVNENFTYPIFNVQGDTLNCGQEVATLSAINVLTNDNLSFVWFDEMGNLVGEGESITTMNEGFYDLVVTDTTNGCQNMETTQVFNETATPQSFSLLINESCEGETNGNITIQSIQGGSPPYTYSINGSNFTNNMQYNDLASGDYLLALMDANGCTLDTLIALNEIAALTVDLGSEIEINLGESIELTPDISNNNIANINWTTNNTLSCTDCENPMATPTQDAVYQITVVDANGCIANDFINVIVTDNFCSENDAICNFSITPNATNGFAQATFTSNYDLLAAIRVYGREGIFMGEKIVMAERGINVQEIDLVTLPAGLYIIEIQLRGQSLVKKVIKTY